jgi:hypothetical protein
MRALGRCSGMGCAAQCAIVRDGLLRDWAEMA